MSSPNKNSNGKRTDFFSLPLELRSLIYHEVLEAESERPRNLEGRVENGSLRAYAFQPSQFHALVYRHGPFGNPGVTLPNTYIRRRYPAILRVNQQMRQEAGDIFFGQLDMRLMVATRHIQTAADYLRILTNQLSPNAPFHRLTLNLSDIGWASFEATLPMGELICTTSFAVDGSFAPQARGRAPSGRPGLAATLQEAVEIGERADGKDGMQ